MRKTLMYTFAALAVAGSAAVAPRAGDATSIGPDVTHFVLDNGLEVAVIPDHRTPVVTHMIWYRVGSADEEPGKSGIAHFLEHLMFKGTQRHPAGHFSQLLARLGGQENAFTAQDYTGYFQRVAREHLATVIELEADRMTGLVLKDEDVNPERDVVLEERRSRTDNNPAALLSEAVQAALFVNHPYGRPVIGWEHEIRALNREDALAFYRRHYAPQNAIVVIAGDVTADEVRPLVKKFYGAVPGGGGRAARIRPREPEPRAHRRVILADARVNQPSLSRSYLVPSHPAAKPDEAEALDLLAQILGGGSLSRLYRTLVVEKQVAAQAGAWYSGVAVDWTRFGIHATPAPGISLEQLETAIDAVIARLADEGVTQAELERAKTGLIAESIYAQDSQSQLARMFGAGLAVGISVEQIRSWPDRIRAVDAESVRQAARKWLDLRRAVTGHLVRPINPEKPS